MTNDESREQRKGRWAFSGIRHSSFVIRHSPPAVPLRLRHVDGLRALAAGLVVWTHFSEPLHGISTGGPAFLGFLLTLPRTLNFGRVGVMIFFAISGFVICRSFNGPREGGARRFVLRRVCRLYPVYWVSMVAGALVWRLDGRELTWPLLAGTATMLPSAFGQPYLTGVYWTLEIELLFYALCLGLYLARGLSRRGVLMGCALVFAAAPRLVRKTGHLLGMDGLALSHDGNVWVISLAVMFWGAAFRLVYDDTGGFRRRPLADAGTWWLGLLIPVLLDLYHPGIKGMFLAGRTERALQEMGPLFAMAIFALWVAVGRVDFRPLTFLGVISYSLYLFHPTVMYFYERATRAAQAHHWLSPWPLWAGLTVCGTLTVALCALTYRWVERPAIALGKRWTGAGRAMPMP